MPLNENVSEALLQLYNLAVVQLDQSETQIGLVNANVLANTRSALFDAGYITKPLPRKADASASSSQQMEPPAKWDYEEKSGVYYGQSYLGLAIPDGYNADEALNRAKSLIEKSDWRPLVSSLKHNPSGNGILLTMKAESDSIDFLSVRFRFGVSALRDCLSSTFPRSISASKEEGTIAKMN